MEGGGAQRGARGERRSSRRAEARAGPSSAKLTPTPPHPTACARFLPDMSYEDWNVDELIIPDEQNLLPREFEIDATARSAPTFRSG